MSKSRNFIARELRRNPLFTQKIRGTKRKPQKGLSIDEYWKDLEDFDREHEEKEEDLPDREPSE